MSCLDNLGNHDYNIAMSHIKEEKWEKEENVEKEEENDVKPKFHRDLFSHPKDTKEFINEISKKLEEIYDYALGLNAENVSLNKNLIKNRIHSLKTYLKLVDET